MTGLNNYLSSPQRREQTVLISTAYGLWPMLEFELDIVQRELDYGNRVIFLHCYGGKKYCPANNPNPGQRFKQRKCQECISRVKNGIEWLEYQKNKLIVSEYESVTTREMNLIQEILSRIDQNKKEKEIIQESLNIDEVDVFESAYSQLITELSDSRPDLEANWTFLRSLLEIGLISYYSAKKVLQKYDPDKVYVFNGRISRYRPLMRLAQKNNCELIVHEYPIFGFEKYTLTSGTYSHNTNQFSRQLLNKFETMNASASAVTSVATDWFKRRSNFNFDPLNEYLFDDTFSHIAKETGLPKNWQVQKFNIVFFISSEFERADIKENSLITPFGQAEAIKLISNLFPEVICTVRIHPHLKSKDAAFVAELTELRNLSNVEVINAFDDYNSYALIGAADLVVTFGSTIGVEAAFRGQPVLNVGPALYSEFNCVKSCEDAEEFLSLIAAALKNDFSSFPLKEQRSEGACKFVYAYLNFGVSPKYLEKVDYFEGYMIRDGKRKKIKASSWIIFKNRMLNFIPRTHYLIRMLAMKPSIVRKIRPSNVFQNLKKAFYGEMP